MVVNRTGCFPIIISCCSDWPHFHVFHRPETLEPCNPEAKLHPHNLDLKARNLRIAKTSKPETLQAKSPKTLCLTCKAKKLNPEFDTRIPQKRSGDVPCLGPTMTGCRVWVSGSGSECTGLGFIRVWGLWGFGSAGHLRKLNQDHGWPRHFRASGFATKQCKCRDQHIHKNTYSELEPSSCHRSQRLNTTIYWNALLFLIVLHSCDQIVVKTTTAWADVPPCASSSRMLANRVRACLCA